MQKIPKWAEDLRMNVEWVSWVRHMWPKYRADARYSDVSDHDLGYMLLATYESSQGWDEGDPLIRPES